MNERQGSQRYERSKVDVNEEGDDEEDDIYAVVVEGGG